MARSTPNSRTRSMTLMSSVLAVASSTTRNSTSPMKPKMAK